MVQMRWDGGDCWRVGFPTWAAASSNHGRGCARIDAGLESSIPATVAPTGQEHDMSHLDPSQIQHTHREGGTSDGVHSALVHALTVPAGRGPDAASRCP